MSGATRKRCANKKRGLNNNNPNRTIATPLPSHGLSVRDMPEKKLLYLLLLFMYTFIKQDRITKT